MSKIIYGNGGIQASAINQSPLVDLAKQYHLTPRETELFKIVAIHGYSNAQAAEVLNTQTKTVSNHMASLLRKTDSSSMRELLSKVINELLPGDFLDHDGGSGKYESHSPE